MYKSNYDNDNTISEPQIVGPHRLPYRHITRQCLFIHTWIITHRRTLFYRRFQLLCVMFRSWWRNGEEKDVRESALQHSTLNSFVEKGS